MKKGSKYITRTQRLMLEDCFNAKLSKKKNRAENRYVAIYRVP